MKNIIVKFLSIFLLFNQLCAIDVSEFGISIVLKSIVSHEHNVTLIMPDGTHITPEKLIKLKTPIHQKSLKIQAQIENKPPFTKIMLSQADNQFVSAHFYYTMSPTVEILPVKTAQIGFRYPKLTEVIPNTTTPIGEVDLIAYKQKNFISIVIDIFGKGAIDIGRSGDWVIVFKHTNTTQPWKKMSIKDVLNAQRQPLQVIGTTKAASDTQLVDQLIMTNKIGKVEIDYKNNAVILLAI